MKIGRAKVTAGLVLWVLAFPFIALVAGLLWRQEMLLTLVFGLMAAVYLLFHHSKEDLLYFSVPFVVGSMGEVVAVALGTYTYNQPSVLGIPLWLPVGWGLVGLIFKHIVQGL